MLEVVMLGPCRGNQNIYHFDCTNDFTCEVHGQFFARSVRFFDKIVYRCFFYMINGWPEDQMDTAG